MGGTTYKCVGVVNNNVAQPTAKEDYNGCKKWG